MTQKSLENTKKQGGIIVFSAASGAGKTTILDRLSEAMPELVYSISATTRPPRNHEKNGLHYFFMSIDEFKQKIEDNGFAEWAEVHGNYYGTPKDFINDTTESGKTIIMDIDVKGKVKFDSIYPEAIGVFIEPPSQQELEKRLRGRNTDSDEVIKTRLENAINETVFAKDYGTYEYNIINDDLEKTVEHVIEVVNLIINKSC